MLESDINFLYHNIVLDECQCLYLTFPGLMNDVDTPLSNTLLRGQCKHFVLWIQITDIFFQEKVERNLLLVVFHMNRSR